MKKLALLCLLLAASAAGAKADGSGSTLVVETNNARTTEFALSARPVISYSGQDMLITAPDGTVTFSRADVAKIYFETSTEGIAAATRDYSIALSGTLLTVAGLTNLQGVAVYDTAGRSAAADTSFADGILTIDFSSCRGNLFIISLPDYPSFKIHIK